MFVAAHSYRQAKPGERRRWHAVDPDSPGRARGLCGTVIDAGEQRERFDRTHPLACRTCARQTRKVGRAGHNHNVSEPTSIR